MNRDEVSCADMVAATLISGIATMPPGGPRASAVGARCTEICCGIRQIRNVLEETDWAMAEDEMSSSADVVARRALHVDRLRWAFETTLGYQLAAQGLKAIELAELSCEVLGIQDTSSEVSRPSSLGTEFERVLDGQYQSMLGQLDECRTRISCLSNMLAPISGGCVAIEQTSGYKPILATMAFSSCGHHSVSLDKKLSPLFKWVSFMTPMIEAFDTMAFMPPKGMQERRILAGLSQAGRLETNKPKHVSKPADECLY